MRLLLIALFLAPSCTGFLARVRDHFEKKVNHLEKRFKKLECHSEWEDVSVIMPQHLTARLPMNKFV